MKNAELKYVASESEDLEVWVQTLLTIYPTIPNIERVISSIIESRAVSSLSTFFAPNGQRVPPEPAPPSPDGGC